MAIALPETPTVRDMTTVDFLRWFWPRWKQGDHVTFLGHTGSGKTTLARLLLRRREYVIGFNTKGSDSSADLFLRREGFVRQQVFDGSRSDRILLWPKADDPDELVYRQFHEFNRAIQLSWKQGRWTWFFDELAYLSDILRMDRRLRWAMQSARSEDITILGATQRPAFIPLVFYSQATHLFLWGENEETNLKRLRNIGGINGRVVAELVQRLEQHQVLYVHSRHPFELIRFHVNLQGLS